MINDGLSGCNSYAAAVETVRQTGWGVLNFFQSGRALDIANAVDRLVADGAQVLPAPGDVFNALHLTGPGKVRAVILGQDPYPTPGDAHGLAFSVASRNHKLPMSLRTIFEALERDMGIKPPGHGNLTAWGRHGVLLLNTALTVEAGKAGAHKALGWDGLAREVLDELNAQAEPVVFMLWGNHAQAAGKSIDRNRHCVIETAHPSPLARGSGPHHRFVEAQPFAQAQTWLARHGLPALDLRLQGQATERSG